MKENIESKTWNEFRKTGLVWWVNRTIQFFGWVIVFEIDTETKETTRVYPARTKDRGFSLDTEELGHIILTAYMVDNAKELLDDIALEEVEVEEGDVD